MKVQILIDNREREIKSYFETLQTPDDAYRIQFCNLDIGDIQFKVDDKIVLIIERKTISDLSSSICDNRYREQKIRLLNSGIDRNRIIYLIEGNMYQPTSIKGGTDTLQSCLINIMFRYEIQVYKTNSLKETIYFIEKVLNKLEKDFDRFWKVDTEETQDDHNVEGGDPPMTKTNKTSTSYTSVIHNRKKDNITPEVWFHSQLCLIPGISKKIADAITLKYPTLSHFLQDTFIMVDGKLPDFKDENVANIEYKIKNEKKRKVGVKVSKKLKNFFFNVV